MYTSLKMIMMSLSSETKKSTYYVIPIIGDAH